MKDRITWELHNSKKIAKFNFTNLAGDDITKLLVESEKFIKSQGRDDLLILFDVENAKMFGDPVTKAKLFAKEIKNYRKKSALVGVNSAKKILLNGLLRFTGSEKDVKAFDTTENAIEWLVK